MSHTRRLSGFCSVTTPSNTASQDMKRPNPLHPEEMTPADRLAEIAEILAAGLVRLRAGQSTPLSRDGGESSLDCPGHQSMHADRLTSDGGLD
jgi:hypothetical protein